MLRSRTSEWILATSKDLTPWMVGNLLRGILNQMTWMYLEVDATLPFTWDKLTILWDANGWVSKFTVFVQEKSTLQMNRTNMTQDIWMPTRCPWGKMSSTNPQKNQGISSLPKSWTLKRWDFPCASELGGLVLLDLGAVIFLFENFTRAPDGLFWLAFWGWWFRCPFRKGSWVTSWAKFLGRSTTSIRFSWNPWHERARNGPSWATGWCNLCPPMKLYSHVPS